MMVFDVDYISYCRSMNHEGTTHPVDITTACPCSRINCFSCVLTLILKSDNDTSLPHVESYQPTRWYPIYGASLASTAMSIVNTATQPSALPIKPNTPLTHPKPRQTNSSGSPTQPDTARLPGSVCTSSTRAAGAATGPNKQQDKHMSK